jgi:hypothetical protein
MPREAHIRVRCNGTIGLQSDPFEIFSYGFSLGAGDFLTVPQLAQLQALVETYHSREYTGIRPTARLTEIAVSTVNALGKQVGDTQRVQTSVAGGGSGADHPPQIAYRVSLDDQIRGRSHKGGWYVPCPGWGIDAGTGQTSLDNAANAVIAAVDLINGLNALASIPNVVIASALGNLPVTRVRVGRAADTVRSRRNSVAEGYQQALVAP